MKKIAVLLLAIILTAMISCSSKNQTSSYQKEPKELEFENKIKTMISEKKNLDGTDQGEVPPIILAVLNNYPDSVRILIKNGANVNIKENITRISPLHAAVKGPDAKRPDKNEEAMVKLLLENKAMVDTVDKMGNTPFLKAARSGRLEILVILADAGANINHVNNDGLQAIHMASEAGYHEILDYFIKKGVDINVLTKDGRSCLDLATLQMMKKQYDDARKSDKEAFAGADYEKTLEILKKAEAKTGYEINPKKRKPTELKIHEHRHHRTTPKKPLSSPKAKAPAKKNR